PSGESLSSAIHRAPRDLLAFPTRRSSALFGVVIAQIVVLDAVFSLDSVITAVGMVEHLMVMMIAVVIAIAMMMVASKPLTMPTADRKSTRLNSSHVKISYAVFCLQKKTRT